MFLNTLKILLFINLIFFILIIINKFIDKQTTQENSYQKIQTSFVFFQRYLDQYFITNIYYTTFAFCIYVITNFLIFLIFRVVTLGQITIFLKTNYYFSYKYIYLLFGIFFAIFFIKYFTHKLFFKEVIKWELYFRYKYTSYFKITHFITNKWTFKILESLSLLCYRIASLSYRSDFFKRNSNDWFNEQIDDNEYHYDTFYQNKYIEIIAENLMYFCHRYSIVSQLFFYFAYILKFLQYQCRGYINVRGFYIYFLYTFLFLIFIYEIHNRELHYFYYASLVYFLVQIYLKYQKYLESLSRINIQNIHTYFYENEVAYNTQRLYIFNDAYSIEKKSSQNTYMEYLFNVDAKRKKAEGIIYSVINNMEDFSTKEICVLSKLRSLMYIRYHVLFAFIIIAVFLWLDRNFYLIEIGGLTMPFLVITFPLFFMIITAKMAFKQKIKGLFTLNEDWSEYESRPGYNIIFWILCILQGYIYWCLLLKPVITLMDTEVLLNISFVINFPEEVLNAFSGEIRTVMVKPIINWEFIKIIKIYTIEEKIQYLYEYFDFYTSFMNTQGLALDWDYLRNILREMNFMIYLGADINMKDIQVYVKLLIDNYVLSEILYTWLFDFLKQKYMEDIEDYFKVKDFFNHFFIVVTFYVFVHIPAIYEKAIWLTINIMKLQHLLLKL